MLKVIYLISESDISCYFCVFIWICALCLVFVAASISQVLLSVFCLCRHALLPHTTLVCSGSQDAGIPSHSLQTWFFGLCCWEPCFLCTSVRNLAEFCTRTRDAEEKMEVSELDGLPCGSQAPGLCTNPALGNPQGLSLGSPVHRYLKHHIWHWKILLAFIVSKMLIWEKKWKA